MIEQRRRRRKWRRAWLYIETALKILAMIGIMPLVLWIMENTY